jgi:amino-acid N-acetyltransferase
VEHPNFGNIVHDLVLLHSLGVRLVLVHGSRPQIESRLAARGLTPHYHHGMRITDAATLDCVIDAVGALRLAIEARLSMDMASSPMQGSRLRVASGNLVTARPIGVLEGVDYHHTGEVRRVDRKGINRLLDERSIVLLSPWATRRPAKSSTWPAKTWPPAPPSTWVPTSCCCSAPSPA